MSPTGDLLVTSIFRWGRCPLELAQRPSGVALALHLARRSAPLWVTGDEEPGSNLCTLSGSLELKLNSLELEHSGGGSIDFHCFAR